MENTSTRKRYRQLYLELKEELHTSNTHLSRLRARAVLRSDRLVFAAGASAQPQSQAPDSQRRALTTLCGLVCCWGGTRSRNGLEKTCNFSL